MTATMCAWCGAHSNMTPVSIPVAGSATAAERYKWVQAAFRCNHCRKLSIGSTAVGRNDVVPTQIDSAWWAEKTLHWTPESIGGREFPDVPEHIAQAADEAFKCRSIGALRSAILLARAVIEATCKHHNVVKGQLAAKIEEMTSRGHIRTHTKEAAHELRHLGNDMAHGDFVSTVDADDADAVLTVMAEILDEVYQGRARVKRMREKRLVDQTNRTDDRGASVKTGARFSRESREQ